MAPRRAPVDQMDLLAWQPPQPVRQFDEQRVRGVSIRERLSRAVSAALKDADARGVTREEVAQRMTDYLGERVSLNALNACASQAREDHSISATRLMALLHATGDQRLVQLLVEPFGWAVIERKYLALIELAQVQEQAAALEKRSRDLRNRARSEGSL